MSMTDIERNTLQYLYERLDKLHAKLRAAKQYNLAHELSVAMILIDPISCGEELTGVISKESKRLCKYETQCRRDAE